jgi:transposase
MKLRGQVRTTKIHALTDALCRPIAFMLTGGNIADCTAGADLLSHLPPCEILHGDKGYDSNAIRRKVESSGTHAEHSAQSQSQLEELLLTFSLSKPQRHRAHVLPLEGLSPSCDAIRSKRRELPRRRLHRCDRQLLVMSLGPR